MANRRPQNGGRRMDYGRNDRAKNFSHGGVSPWQGGGPSAGLPNLLPLQGSTEATLALANNLISNLLQSRQAPVPSLLDMPIRRDFRPDMGRYDHRQFGPMQRMGNHGNFRRPGNYNRPGERNDTNRKPFKPAEGQRNQNRNYQKKDADSKAKPAKESEADAKTESEADTTTEAAPKEDGKKEQPKTRYDDLNPELLKCHICNKFMWDGRSFENHLSGRAHAIMMQKTVESYALTADTMRQEFKIREMKRTRKTGQQTARDFYCAMCDMYAGDGAAHRTTVGHRKLKKYLHPACTSCHKEMPTRIELDEHRLTPEHLRRVNEKHDVTAAKPKPEVMVISTLSTELSYVRDDRQRKRQFRKKPAVEEATDQSAAEVKKEGEEETPVKTEVDADAPAEAEAEAEATPVAENFVVDYSEGDDLTGVTADKIPTYSTTRGVGRSFLEPFSCVQCKLCHKLLDSQETAEVHLKTWLHHQLFAKLLREKAGLNQDAGKRVATADPEGREDSKRRKTAPDADADENADGDENADADGQTDADATKEQSLDASDSAAADAEWDAAMDEILATENTGCQNGGDAED